MIILAAWLSKKINSPRLAALLGLVLIGVAIYGLATDKIVTILAIVIIAVGVMNLMRILPHADEPAAGERGSRANSPG